MVRAGKIVWMDMGMMGRLTEADRKSIIKAVEGVALNDIGKIQDAVLSIGQFRDKPDQSRLYEDIRNLLSKYGNVDLGKIDVAELLADLMEVMKENKISMPHGLTLLARSLAHMEGVLAEISPEINLVQIAVVRLKNRFFEKDNWKKELTSEGKKLYRSIQKSIDIPSLITDVLQGYMKGQTRIKLDLRASDDLAWLLRKLIRNIVIGLWVMALLISSSIICTTDMYPKLWGIPALGILGYFGAFVIVLYVVINHIISKRK